MSLPHLFVKGFSEQMISSVTDRSSDACAGSVFVIIKGELYDGADFLGEVRGRGGRVFVSERDIPLLMGETLIIVESARRSLAEISRAVYFSSQAAMRIIGVTGTKGKSTVSKLVFECLRRVESGAVMVGTLGTESFGLDIARGADGNTTPSSAVLYKTLAAAAAAGGGAAVIEVSSQALATFRTYLIPFDLCIFTNFSQDHIGIYEHATVEDYYLSKRRLFEENPNAVAVVNSDDEHSIDISRAAKKVIGVSRSGRGEYAIERVRSDIGKTSFALNGEPFSLSLGGGYNAMNASLALAAVSELYGIGIGELRGSIASVRVRGRYEPYILSGRYIIIDFAHNTESFRAVCESAYALCSGRLIVVFGSVGGRCYHRRRELAEVAERYADIAVITSDNPCDEDPSSICTEIAGAFKRRERVICEPNRERAIRLALDISHPSDYILLLGKGHEEYQLVRGVYEPFSERDIILSLGASEYDGKM